MKYHTVHPWSHVQFRRRTSQSGRRFQHSRDAAVHDPPVECIYGTLFCHAERDYPLVGTNIQRVRGNDTISSDADGSDRTDALFHDMAARVAFDTFLGFVPDSDQKTSAKWVVRADALMTCVIEELQRRLKGVARGAGTVCTENPIQRTNRCGTCKSASRGSHMSSSHVNN